MSEQAQRTAVDHKWPAFVHSSRSSSECIQRGYFAMALGNVSCDVVRGWCAATAGKR
ncbi:MAG TPA: hypothetical protein VF331_07840 [Polyangiales bacterium]